MNSSYKDIVLGVCLLKISSYEIEIPTDFKERIIYLCKQKSGYQR